MAYYLGEVAYTPATWSTLVKQPQNRIDLVRPVIEQLGGSVECTYLSFGEYNVVLIYELPDNVSAAAFSIAVQSGGGVKAYRTTPLMTVQEAMEAMSKASQSGYNPPSAYDAFT